MIGILVRRAFIGKKNIGDYIQTAAQEQFWSKTDMIVDREHLDAVHTENGEKVNLIMNSWWMWNPESFPPSEDINPLFVSMHISPNIADRMLRPESVDYLKRYEPIGARDKGTMAILDKFGIKNYFSGCLTLTLGKSYSDHHRSDKVFFVDPEYSLFAPMAVKDWIHALLLLIRHWRVSGKLSRKYHFEKDTVFSKISGKLNKRVCAIWFFKQYRRYFSDELIVNAEYISHMVDVERDFPTNEACLKHAKALIKRYAAAKMVITSRIHAGLPCLGLETPVVFVKSKRIDSGAIEGRLGGLLDLFNHQFTSLPDGLHPATEDMESLLKNGKISEETVLHNSTAYLQYKQALERTVEEFVSNVESPRR